MKKFNLKLLTPLLLILVLEGCMPDSLTKFKKDPPKKASSSTSTTPVVDSTGATISFSPPTVFYFYNSSTNTFKGTVGQTLGSELASIFDGSLGNPELKQKFRESCALDLTGNAQTQILPSGLTLNPEDCIIWGTPISIAAVTTAFCSNPAYLTQSTCEAAPLTWNATTSKCSNPDYQYTTQATCVAAKNKWYKVGSPIPYRIVQTYHNEYTVQSTISTTINIGIYKQPAAFTLTQSDKVLLSVTASTSGNITDIVPVVTTTASTGAYARANIMSGETAASGVAKLVDTTLNKIGIDKLVALYVDNPAPFTQYGFISVLGTCSNAAYVTRASCLAAAAVWTDSGVVGKIFSIDSTLGILYVENISTNNKYFKTNDKISSDANGYISAASIIEADDTYIFSDTTIDNDSQFYEGKYNVTDQTSVYETGSAFTIRPIVPISPDDSLSLANGVTFKISPALPPGLSFDTSTGMISGAFNDDLSSTKFTITATNDKGSASGTISLSAIAAPTDYSLTNKQIITVSNTSFFKEGEEIFQPITPPLTESYKAKILKILSSYQMAIETYNSDFLEGASLDSGSSYNSEKAFIIPDESCVNTNYTTKATCEAAAYTWSTGPVYYNVALTINTTGGYVAGDVISTTAVVAANTNGAGARGIVAGVYTAARDILFVQYLTSTSTGVSTVKTFYEGDTVNSGTTIYQVDNSFMKLSLTDPTGFLKGADIVSSGNAGAYTHTLNGSVISVSDITKQPAGTLFKVADTVYNHEQQSTSTNNTTITAVTYDNFFVLERAKKASFHGNIVAGNGIAYSITPSLPAGLSLNTATGDISGTATVAMPRKDFLITATNFIGSVTFITSLEVRDYFQIADSSGTHSFVLHKSGDTQINRKCRIDSNDILSATPSKALDIRCFLDAEEQDLYENPIKFNGIAGPGVCEYVQYAPYYFQQFSTIKSLGTSSKYPAAATVIIGCTTGGTVPDATLCESNYATASQPNLPNCDEGYLDYNEEIWSDPGTGCALASTSVKKVQCGGTKANCIAGPVTKILNTSQLQAGKRSLIYNSVAGLNTTWTLDAPIDFSDLTNLRVSNGSLNNQCFTTNADVNTWTTRSVNTSGIVSPLGTGTNALYPYSNPYYVFNCLDAAKEIKARIRITVRDWDKSFRIDSGIDNQSFAAPAALMNVAGIDPVFGTLYNNYPDWDDDYTGTGAATYTGGSCGTHFAGGACSNAILTTQFECELYGNTWAGDEEYKFPEDSI